MAKKRNTESASVFERSGIRAIRARAIEVLLYYADGACLTGVVRSIPCVVSDPGLWLACPPVV